LGWYFGRGSESLRFDALERRASAMVLLRKALSKTRRELILMCTRSSVKAYAQYLKLLPKAAKLLGTALDA